MANITETTVYPDSVFLSGKEEIAENVYGTVAGTQGTCTDNTTYPVATQAAKTEKVTIDGGTEQTVTFTNAINVGRAITSNAFPLGSQDSKTEKVTIDGGSEQTVTFAGAITAAADIAAQMDAQLYGCSVAVVGTTIVITSDTTGPTSAVAIGTGTTDLTWGTPAAYNTAAGIASQMNAQLTGCNVYESGGHVVVESDTVGTTSTVAIGTGTATLSWGAPSDGTGVSGDLTIEKGTVMSRNTATGYIVPYVASGADGVGTPLAVLDSEAVYAVSGSKRMNVARAGRVDAAKLVVAATGAAPTALEKDDLMKNSGIVCATVTTTARTA